MITMIPCLLVGCLCIAFGVINTSGNLSTLHSYHYHRVSRTDRVPFGRLIGLGTIVCGVSVIAFGICMMVFEKIQSNIAVWIGTALLIFGLIVGMGISFYAMKKYNKGIF